MGCACCKGKKNGGSGKDIKGAIESKKKLCVWILGGPGSGKGTQCKMLALHFKLAHLSSGDLLRNVLQQDIPLAKQIKAVMDSGGLVDTETVLGLITRAMEEAYDSCNGYLIDGYPREVDQGQLFCEKLGAPHVIIYLDCPDDILMERLLKRGKDSGRADDNEQTIKNRLITFHSISEAVITQWSEKVVKVDGTLTPQDVEKECIKIIEKLEEEQKAAMAGAK